MTVDLGDSFDFSEFDGLDLGQPEITPEATQPSTNPVEESVLNAEPEVRDNPAWAAILEKIPVALHPMIKPALKDWDRGVSAKFQEHAAARKEWETAQAQYEPYKQIIDQGIDPQFLQQSMQAAFMLRQNPVAFLENLKQTLVARGQYQEAAAVQQKQDEVSGQQPGQQAPYVDEYDQRLQQQSQQIEQMQQLFEQQQAQQEYNTAYAQTQQQIENDFSTIERTIGQSLPDIIKEESLKRAIALGQQQGREVSVVEGFRDYQRFMLATRQARAAAPKVISPTGHIPAPVQKDPTELTLEDRKNMLPDILQRLANG